MRQGVLGFRLRKLGNTKPVTGFSVTGFPRGNRGTPSLSPGFPYSPYERGVILSAAYEVRVVGRKGAREARQRPGKKPLRIGHSSLRLVEHGEAGRRHGRVDVVRPEDPFLD